MLAPIRCTRLTRPWSTRRRPIHSIAANDRFFRVSEEVREAVHFRRPVVALETTIYTHGLPHPENQQLASELESIVRSHGGIPATIGIVDGQAVVGLSRDELGRLCESASDRSAIKISRRDLAYACRVQLPGRGQLGGTTIAGTMLLAHRAGIKVFATGGLGGVHRGAESSMDISADLTELGRTPVAVIASGCKGFLDIPRTLEYLETQGVCVATLAEGRGDKVDFPAFWCRESGSPSPLTVQNAGDAAAMIYAQSCLNVNSGLLFANPIPQHAEIPVAEMKNIIDQAISEATAAGAAGKDNTPYILNRIKELTHGRSVDANRVLVRANVTTGTQIALHLSRLERGEHTQQINAKSTTHGIGSSAHPTAATKVNEPDRTDLSEGSNVNQLKLASSKDYVNAKPVEVIVAGALAVDTACDYTPRQSSAEVVTPKSQTSNPCVIKHSLGGVGHNIARAIHYLGASVRLCSAVANDPPGDMAVEQLKRAGMDSSGIQTVHSTEGRTAQYVAINDVRKDLVIAMADMILLESTALPTQIIDLSKPRWLVIDANWHQGRIREWLQYAKVKGIKTAFEPVSVAKGTRLFDTSSLGVNADSTVSKPITTFPDHIVDITTPNQYELASLFSHAREAGLFERKDWFSIIDTMGIPSTGARSRFIDITSAELADQGIPQQSVQLLPFMPCILTKLGARGVLLTMLLGRHDSRLNSAESSRYILARSRHDDDATSVGGVYMRLFSPAEHVAENEIVSVNGVGDTFLGALIAAIVKTGRPIEDLVDFAQRAAVQSLKSSEAVNPDLDSLASELKIS